MAFDIQWPLVLFSLLAGVGAMTFASAALLDVLKKGEAKACFLATVVGMVLVVVGGCCSVLHLALPQNVMAAVTNILSFSGISIELVLLGVTFVLGVAYAILLKREASDAVRRVVAIVGIVAAFLLAFFCGHGYVMPGRPLWDTELLPLAYWGTSFAGGALVFACLRAGCGESAHGASALRVWNVLAAVASIGSVAAYVAHLAINGVLVDDALAYAAVGIIGAVVGLVCAVVLFLRPGNKGQLAVACVGAIGSVVAGLLVRVLMWIVCVGYVELFAVAETTRTWFF